MLVGMTSYLPCKLSSLVALDSDPTCRSMGYLEADGLTLGGVFQPTPVAGNRKVFCCEANREKLQFYAHFSKAKKLTQCNQYPRESCTTGHVGLTCRLHLRTPAST